LEQKRDVLRETDAEAIRLARTLIREARFGALAALDPDTGAPLASRVGVATDADGTPVILTSMLSAHTPAILADPRCSLMVGEPGKGDPLAHARISLACRARRIEKDTPEHERIARRYLCRNPKAKLYAGLGDFSYFRLEVERASLNGGFGRAYALTAADVVLDSPVVEALAAGEQRAVDHMNEDHLEAVALYARHFAGNREPAEWTISGIDLDGLDLIDGDKVQRVFFPEPLKDAAELRPVLVAMARTAREAGEEGQMG
jgi:putative heme iron utilization protein